MTEASRPLLEKIKKILSARSLDWAYFLKRVQDQRLAPLLYKAFLKIEGSQDIIPADAWGYLQDSYYTTLSNNMAYLTQLEKISAAFQEENIRMIVFKGLMLAESVYGDIGLRSSSDVDILVKKEDIFKVDRILRKFNYRTDFKVDNFKEVYFNHYRNSWLYSNHQAREISFHIFWHIINLIPYNRVVSCGIDIDKIWQEAEPIRLGNVSVFTFSTHFQIIYLAMHALSHCFYPLILLCDINEFLSKEGARLDWDKLVCQADQTGLNKHVYYALYLCSQMLETKVPLVVLDKLRPRRMSLFERRFISGILEGRPVFSEDWLVYFGMNETLKDRFLFLYRALFPSRKDFAFIRQKDVSLVNISDYLHRWGRSLRSHPWQL